MDAVLLTMQGISGVAASKPVWAGGWVLGELLWPYHHAWDHRGKGTHKIMHLWTAAGPAELSRICCMQATLARAGASNVCPAAMAACSLSQPPSAARCSVMGLLR